MPRRVAIVGGGVSGPTLSEGWPLPSIRYESELHNHTVDLSDATVLPDSDVVPLASRSNHTGQ